jgi:uncharacterized glyoxalase superfamily protein PhnB
MLIDWENVGLDRSFEIPVRDMRKARLFYQNVLGAHETFRKNSDKAGPVRLGLRVGKINFELFSMDHGSDASALLSMVAEEFDVPYVAIILPIDNPDHMLCKAVTNGAQLVAASNSEDIAVVKDPFGSHWAFARRKTAETSSPFRFQKGYGESLRH